MLFLWQVEVNPSSEKEKWLKEIGKAFDIDCLKKEIGSGDVRECNTPERSWFLTVYEQLRKIKRETGFNITIGNIGGKDLRIVDITCRFSRYEGKKFLLFMLEIDDHQGNFREYENIITVHREIKELLGNKYKSDYTNINEYDTIVKVEKFIEKIRLQNPVIILDETFENQVCRDNSWKKVNSHDYGRYYKIEYLEKKKSENESENDRYIRELNVVYFINKDKLEYDEYDEHNKPIVKRSSFFDAIHTEFLFFVRGNYYEKELEEAYQETNFLNEVISKLESNWIKARSLFSLLPRFSIFNEGKGSKIFFYLLEISAQVNSLLMKIRFSMERKKIYYKDAFERLHFTIEKEGTIDEKEYYKWLHQLVCQGFDAYFNKVDLLGQSAGILSSNIQQLRADFDSNTNVTLQWLMFLLSIVLIIWGAFTILYDKWVLPLEIAINRPIRLIVGILIGVLALMLAAYLVLAHAWIDRTLPIKKELRDRVRGWLIPEEGKNKNGNSVCDANNNSESIYDLFKEYLEDMSKDTFQNKVIKQLAFFYLLVTAVALRKISPDEGLKVLKIFEQKSAG